MGSGRRGAATGDVRLDRRGAWLIERIVATGSLCLREVGGTRGGEMGAHRYLSSPKITVEAVLAPHVARTAAAVSGRRVVAVADTTEINFCGRDRGRTGLGPAGNGAAKGFFIHPVIAVDADAEALLGVAGAEIWTRAAERVPPRKGRALADKESSRWLRGAEAAAAVLAAAREIIVVADREGDIYPFFARRPAGTGLIVRAAQDRRLADGGRLFAAAAGWPELGRLAVRVAPRGPGDTGRVARVAVKAGAITLARPQLRGLAGEPASLTLGLVEAAEVDVAPGATRPLLWRLLTTLPVTSRAAAAEVVRLYRLRWRIEQVFRTLKSDGLRLEASQVESAGRLFNLAAAGLAAAAQIIQLVDARDGSARPATDVVAAGDLAAVAAVGASLEGATARQQNPHPAGSLAFLAWVVARLGGWNCYYKPPGPKTMARGLDRLAQRLAGFRLAAELQNV